MRFSSSISEAVPEQSIVELAYTPLLGVTVAESTVGAVFSTITLDEVEEALAPWVSVTLAVQLMPSPTSVVLASITRVE